MKLNYPLKDDRLKNFINAASHYQINETSSPELNDLQIGGWYPVGYNDFFHAGVHFNGDRPVHAVADGRIVAYRVMNDYIAPSQLTCQFEEPEGTTRKYIEHPISNNFVLTKHRFKPAEGNPFNFYMLFMHLQPLEELKEDQKKALTIFHTSTVTVKRFDDPDGKGLILFNEKGREIAIMPKGTAFTLGLQNGSPPFDLTWAIKANFSRVHFEFYGESFTGYAKITGKCSKTDDEYIVTTDESKNNRRNGLNIRERAFSGGKVIDIAPIGAELLFDKMEEIVDDKATLKKPTDGQYYKKITGYIYKGKITSVHGYVYVHDKYLKAEKRYNPVVNTVTNPDDLEVRKGDVLGWAGMDGTSDKKKMVHVELFITNTDDLQALRDYTTNQLEKNTDLVQEHLLSLNEANILDEDDINKSYVRLEYVCDVSGLMKKACTENNQVKFFDIRKAVSNDTIAPKLRTMVTKHHPEWLPVDKDEKIKKRLEEPPYLWSAEKYNAYKEIYFEKLGFWDQLNGFPDECYYFHPIKFIEHLNKLIPKPDEITIELLERVTAPSEAKAPSIKSAPALISAGVKMKKVNSSQELVENTPDSDYEVVVSTFAKKGASSKTAYQDPLKVEFTFIDMSPANTDKIKSFEYSPGKFLGKANDSSAIFWKDHVDCVSSSSDGYKTKCSVETITNKSSVDLGKAKVNFKPSNVGGDDYEIEAKVLDATGNVLKKEKLKPFTIWRKVELEAYEMPGFTHVSTHGTEAKMANYYTPDTFVKYKLGTMHPIRPTFAIKYVGLWDHSTQAQKNWSLEQQKKPSETPTASEIANANGPVGSAQTAARNAIQNKAQAWMDRMFNNMLDSLKNWPVDAGIPANSIMALQYCHPKYDSQSPSSDSNTNEWSAFPWLQVNYRGKRMVHPDQRWNRAQSFEFISRVFILDGMNPRRAEIVIAHEIGHTTRNQFKRDLFGTANYDHSPTLGLMDPWGRNPSFTVREKRILRGIVP